jgi:hypothetical protein
MRDPLHWLYSVKADIRLSLGCGRKVCPRAQASYLAVLVA